MADEGHCTLCGSVNTRNVRYRSTENPQIIDKVPTHLLKFTLWCAVCWNRVICQYFFEYDNGVSVAVNGMRYQVIVWYLSFILRRYLKTRFIITNQSLSKNLRPTNATKWLELNQKHLQSDRKRRKKC